jgi:diguanylate cyclase
MIVPAQLVLFPRPARRPLPRLRKPLSINGNAVNVTGSIGVAVYPDDATDEVFLRRLVDERMYEQKRQIPLRF